MISSWVDALPDGWRAGRLDHVANAWPSNVDKHTVEGQVPVRLCNYTDVYGNDSISADLDFMAASATHEQVDRFRLRRGDTVITKDSETADDIGVPAFVDYEASDFVCGYHLAIVRPSQSVDPRFLYWVMASQTTRSQWAVLASGVTRVGIRSTDLRKIAIPLPPLHVQRFVANYLDRETARIDELIAAQQCLVELLSERRRSVLDDFASRVVGETRKLKYLFNPSSEGNRPNEEVLSVYRDYGVIPKASRFDNFNRTPDDTARYLLVRPGDLVVNRMKAWQGSLGISEYRGIVSGDYEVARPASDCHILPTFAHYLLRSPRLIAQYAMRSTGIRPSQWRLYWQQMGLIEIPVPSLEMQQTQVNHLEEQLAQIDVLALDAERLIELERERRSALITVAVTGQMDFRGAPDSSPTRGRRDQDANDGGL